MGLLRPLHAMAPLAAGLAVCTVLGPLVLAAAGCPQRPSSGGPARPGPLSARLKDADLEQAAYERTAAKVHMDPQDSRGEAKRFAALNAGQKMVLATFECEAEVNNGGFHQYFWNTQGRHAQAALDGYRLIGAKRHAGLVQRAIATARAEAARMDRLRAGASRADFDRRFAESEEHSALNALDDPFYKAEATESVTPLRAKYIRKHITDF